jgi:hypothetical protein
MPALPPFAPCAIDLDRSDASASGVDAQEHYGNAEARSGLPAPLRLEEQNQIEPDIFRS